MKPVIVAHRGLHLEHPENSLAAFRAAWKAGIDWCECDIHLGADGEPIVLHDDTLDRTTSGQGPITSLPSEELSRLKLRDELGRATEERLPLLQTLLDAMPQDAGLLVEIKPRLQRHEVYHVLRMLDPKHFIVQSFHADVMELVRQCDTRFQTALLVEEQSGFFDERTDFGPWTWINGDHRIMNGVRVRLMHEDDKSVGAWTVNDSEVAKSLRAMRVDTLITDRPDLVTEAFLG